MPRSKTREGGIMKHISAPLTDTVIADLHAGDEVALSGTLYTARDQAHKRLSQLLENNAELPFDLTGQVLYYTGPTPPRPGSVIGACGPTTSSRMDPYTEILLQSGIKGMIGKGRRSLDVEHVIVNERAVYFVAVGGAGALLSSHITECNEIAFSDLGTESVKRLVVKDLPLFVANDIYGGTIFQE